MTKAELIAHLDGVPDDAQIMLTDMYAYNRETENLGIAEIGILGIANEPETGMVRFVVDQSDVRKMNINRAKDGAEHEFKMTWLMSE